MSEQRSSARKVIPLPAHEEDALGWEWMMAQLCDEAHAIRAALDEHVELGSDDWTAALSMWGLQFTGFQLAAAGCADPGATRKI